VLLDILLGVAIGLITGLLSWWIIARFVRPLLVIVPDISKLPDETGAARWRYRIKVLNKRRRLIPHTAAVDLHVTATVRILGLRESAPKTWYTISVPVGRTGDLAYVRWNSALRLRLHNISEDQMMLLPQSLQGEIKDASIELESLLALGSKAQLRVVATAAHSYTLGRSIAVRRFRTDSIHNGPFEAAGERVVEDGPEDGADGDVQSSTGSPAPETGIDKNIDVKPPAEGRVPNRAGRMRPDRPD
jgi:hypothetical protein